MHITLTGNLGSGKSTICKILENEKGYEIYSTGKVQRKLAEELGISVLEMNRLMCEDHKYDNMIDDTTAKIARENPEKAIVFDSRLAWNFVEKSFKVFLSVSLPVAAERVYGDNRGVVETYASTDDAARQLKLRAETENVRYKEIYGLEYFKFSNYDLVLDSTFSSPKLLVEVLLREAELFQKESRNTRPKLLMSPKRLGITDVAALKDTSEDYLKDIVKIKKTDFDYSIAEGAETAEKAALLGIPFVLCELE